MLAASTEGMVIRLRDLYAICGAVWRAAFWLQVVEGSTKERSRVLGPGYLAAYAEGVRWGALHEASAEELQAELRARHLRPVPSEADSRGLEDRGSEEVNSQRPDDGTNGDLRDPVDSSLAELSASDAGSGGADRMSWTVLGSLQYVNVHQDRSMSSPIVGRKDIGESVRGVRDGRWLALIGEPGFISLSEVQKVGSDPNAVRVNLLEDDDWDPQSSQDPDESPERKLPERASALVRRESRPPLRNSLLAFSQAPAQNAGRRRCCCSHRRRRRTQFGGEFGGWLKCADASDVMGGDEYCASLTEQPSCM